MTGMIKDNLLDVCVMVMPTLTDEMPIKLNTEINNMPIKTAQEK